MDRWWEYEGVSDRVPMSGGLGGMEIDGDEVPVVHVTVQSASPQKRSAKGKESAMESDADMLVNDEERKERSQGMKGLCCFFIFLFMTGAHLFLAFTFRNTKRFKITCQRHLCTPIACFPPTSNAIFPNLKNGTIFGCAAYNIRELQRRHSPPKPGEDRMPPKMRKQWIHREIEAMKEAAGDREVALELEERPGTRMVGLEIRLEKTLDRLGMLFFLYDFRSGT